MARTYLSHYDAPFVSEWIDDKNLPDTKENTTFSSAKKVWWRCSTCGYEWIASVNSRKSGRGCPFCAGKAVITGVNDLLTVDPRYGQWWDDPRYSPTEFMKGSRKKIHWKCPNGHQFERTIKRMNFQCSQCVEKPLSVVAPHLVPEYADSNELGASEISYNSARKVTWICADCSHEWLTPVYQRVNLGTGCPRCSKNGTSRGQEEVEEFVKELLGDNLVVSRDTTVLGGKELDIYIPSKNIAIEYNGLYWHGEKFKDKNDHYNKWKSCHDKGIQLITIWEDDWASRQHIVMAMLSHKLGVSSQDRVFARNCLVTEVSAVDARDFCELHHIQGYVQGTKYYALIHDGVMVALSIWKKVEDTLYLERYCTSCHVIGGMGKLLKYGKELANEHGCSQIVTFADHGVSDGSLYEKLGFMMDKELDPDYAYVYRGERVHKSNFRKSRFRDDPLMVFDDSLSETELAILNGVHRVWDAGKYRYVMRM